MRRTKLVITVAGVGLVMASAAACSSNATPAAAPTTSALTVSASPSPSATGPSTQALAAYNGMVKLMESMFAAAEFNSSISSYTYGTAQQQLVTDVSELRTSGYMTVGSLSNDPAVSSVNTLTHPETVTITDCWDASKWRYVYATDTAAGPVQATNKPATVATATVTDESFGWRVTTFTIGSTPCTVK